MHGVTDDKHLRAFSEVTVRTANVLLVIVVVIVSTSVDARPPVSGSSSVSAGKQIK
jgi:hypothetical protein